MSDGSTGGVSVLPLLSREGERAQTEPLAALFAVAAFGIALSLYGVAVTDVLSSTSDREVGDQTLELVWEDIETNGAYDNTGSHPLTSEIETDSIPSGFNLVVQVQTISSSGSVVVIGEARYAWDRDSTVQDPPEGATTTARPISIRNAPGNITTGRLRVTVWEP